MIGLILAAGRGSRLKSLSQNKPKPFINLYKSKTIIDYQVSVLKKINVKKIIIIVGYKKKFFYKKFANDKKIHFLYNKQWKTTNVLGSFSLALNNLNDDFIFLHADSIAEIKLYKKFLKSKSSILPFKKKQRYPLEDMKLYIKKKKIYLSKKNIINLLPQGEFLGIALFKKNLIKELKIKNKILKTRKEYSKMFFEDLINEISNRYKMKTFNINKIKFVEIDYKNDLDKVKIQFMKYFSNFF